MDQKCKPIPGYEGLYDISIYGEVRSLNYRGSGKIKELKQGKWGFKPFGEDDYYLAVNLTKNSKNRRYAIHQLLAMAFLGFIPDGMKKTVSHKNRIPYDNRIENLQILSAREHAAYDMKETKKSGLPTGVIKYNGRDGQKKSPKKSFRSFIQIEGKNKFLGSYYTPEEAGKAYQKKLLEIKSLEVSPEA